MPVGTIILLIISVLIFLGLAQRVLDRLRLTDRAALIFIAAMLIGTYLPDIPLANDLFINIGGGVIPIVLVGYLLVRAGTSGERKRAVAAAVVTVILVYGAVKILPVEPTYNPLIDPLFIIAIIAGVIGYLAGRSRRSAFIAGVSAIILNDIIGRIEAGLVGGRGPITIGGAGIFDATVIAGLVALGLAEVIGETRERIQGGPEKDRPAELKDALSDVEFGVEDKPDDEGGHSDEQDEGDK